MATRHTTYFINEIKPIQFCGKTVMWQLDLNGAFELPFEREPTKGEHDFTTCEVCRKTLAELTKRLTVKFEGNQQIQGFPLCCSSHSNLLKVKEFNKALFSNVPEMVAKKIVYTNQHIINNQSSENCYKVITDYIEWVIESFGQMPKDCGERLYLSDYFFYVTDLLKRNKEIKTEIKARLIEFLIAYQTPKENPKTDLNVLLATYQKWFKEFPFELNSYFGSLKQHFEKHLPILNGKPETNIYSGMAKAKMHTKSTLIEALVNLTNSLLIQINGVTLYEKGLITDANKIKLELVINSRKLKLKEGYKNNSPNEEQQYRKVLKEWFKDEINFINEIKHLISNESDVDFIKGQYKLTFVPQYNDGYYTVEKNNYIRKFTLEKYFDLHLQNWEYCIDNLHSKIEKIQAVNNAIFDLKKDLYDNQHPKIVELITKNIKHFEAIIEYINSNYIELSLSQENETKTDKIKSELSKYGFFELPEVKQLSDQSKQSLVELIGTNSLPYSIAMFEFLGFLKYLENHHFDTKGKLNKEVAKWFNSDKEGRAVKGNISSLSIYSKEKKSRYTAHTHKETVKTDYQKLK